MKKLLLVLFILLLPVYATSAVIFQDNFDGCTVGCADGTTPPNSATWDAWGSDPPTSNTVDSVTHPTGEITSPGRGGTGKSLKLWRNGTTDIGSASYTGALYKTSPGSYSDLYIRYYMKLPTAMDFYGSGELKLFRLNTSGGEVYLDILNGGYPNNPVDQWTRGIGWLGVASGNDTIFHSLLNASQLGATWDGNWHAWQFRFDFVGHTVTIWIDGVLQTTVSVPLMTGTWNDLIQHFPIGNQQNTYWQASWQAIEVDDLVIATTKAETDPIGGIIDTTPPVVSAGAPSGNLSSGTTSTTMTVVTDEAATCKYSNTAAVAYASMTNTFTTTGGTTHSVNVSGLVNNSSYNEYVRCQDASGNADTADYVVSWSVGVSASIFSESFETSINNNRGWIDGSMTDIVSGGQSGNALRWTWNSGATQPTGSNTVRHDLGADYQQLFIRYYVQFDPAWRGSEQTYHPHYLQILSNQDFAADPYGPTANNYLALYLEALSDLSSPYNIRPNFGFQDEKRVNTSFGTPPVDLRAITENRSTAYCNQPLPSSAWVGGCYADTTYYSADIITSATGTISKGAWHQIDTWIKMNSIVSGIGQQDGVAQIWVDGVLVTDQHNVQFKTNQNPALAFRELILAPWIGVGAPITETMYIDELTVWSTNQRDVADTTPPVISNGSPSGALASGTTSTVLSVTTDENATCKYSNNAGITYASMLTQFATTGATSHNTTISGLSNGSTYMLYIKCIDGSGNADPNDYVVSWTVNSASSGNILLGTKNFGTN